MEIIITGLICLLIGLGGGGLIGYNVAPKQINNIQNVYNTTTQEVKTTTMQNVLTGQFTVVSAVTNLRIDIKGITNLLISYSTNSNFTSITNVIR